MIISKVDLLIKLQLNFNTFYLRSYGNYFVS